MTIESNNTNNGGKTKFPTLFDTFYNETDNPLYHYCSADAFEAILSTDNIRFSDINMLNDAAEMSWGYSIFLEAGTQLLNSSDERDRKYISKSFMDKVDSGISSFGLSCPLLTASFSLRSDDLSQWRSYGANGSGFAVGFNPKFLTKMPCTLLRCSYDEHKQIEMLSNSLRAMAVRENERKEKYGPEFTHDCNMLWSFVPAFKNPSFASEEEVRGVRMLIASEHESGGLKIDDPGGNSTDENEEEIDIEPQPVAYRVRGNEIIMHQDINYVRGDKAKAVSKVTIGPTNPNFVGNISAFLNHHGLEKAEIETSSSSYRG